MLKLLRKMRRREWGMAAVCTLLILGQIYFDLALPDYMSDLTVLIESPESAMSDILRTGAEMLGCILPPGCRPGSVTPSGRRSFTRSRTSASRR